MDIESLTYKTILNNMDDGVVSVDRGGRIVTFNTAAATILGMSVSDVQGRIFGEAFLLLEGLEPFTQALLDAIGERRETGRKVIEIEVGGEVRLLTISTSYPCTGQPEAGQVGVIAVFTDITEIRELRDTEARLGEKIKTQYRELQDAYRTIEKSNKDLSATLQRARIVRAVAVGAVLVIFAGVGFYTWDRIPAGPAESVPASLAALHTVIVEPQRLQTTISVPGRLAARQDTHVVSPITGRVSKLHFRYGDKIERDQVLVTLDTSKVTQEHRALRAKHISSVKRVQELEDWENSRDMANARRSLSRSKRSLEKQKHKVEETTFLLDKGVIPASEHTAATEQYTSLQLDYEASQQELEAVREKGGDDALEIARLEHRNLAEQLQELEAAMARAIVLAPVAGVVMQPPMSAPGAGEASGQLLEGEQVSQGQPLLTLADVTTLSVTGTVDEVDIVNLRVDQPVRVTSDAFPGAELRGRVTHFSSQAINVWAGPQDAAVFSVVAAISDLDPVLHGRLRLGMSADMLIIIHDAPDALLVPISAVYKAPDGAWSVQVRDRDTGETRGVPVETGTTTREAVEITAGIAPGDEVVVTAAQAEAVP